MTKRFTETISTGIVTDNKTGIEYICEMRIDYDFLNLVNTIAEENERLQTQLSQLAKSNREGVKKVQSLAKENEQLKKRNENQYNQLTELWQIIEEENWEKLIAMKKELKEDEERLQKEWVCYE